MADYVITAANVKPGAGAEIRTNTAGEAITAGQSVYKDSAGKMYKADVDDQTKQADGIAVSTAEVADQPLTWVGNDGAVVTVGATTGTVLAAGQTLVASNTAGGLKPEADLSASEYYSLVAIGKSATEIRINIDKTDIQHA